MDWRRRCQTAGGIGDWSPIDGRDSVVDHNRTGRRRSCAGASDDAPSAISQASAGRIVARTPRLRSGALAQFAARTAPLRGCDRVRRYLDRFQPRTLTMSSTLRLSIITVMLLATAALGLIAYNNMMPKPVVQVTQDTPTPAPAPPPAPVTVGYFVAAHPLPAGTLAREEDFTVRSVSPDNVPSGAIIDTPEVRIGLRGSLVRTFLDTGSLVTSQNVLRPRDRGFLASVLAPGTRAISIKVDAESGVSGLIWPGDYVDVVASWSSPGV